MLGVSNVAVSIWRLDPTRHCCALKGLLPYREVSGASLYGGSMNFHLPPPHTHMQSLLEAQKELLYHVVSQQNSKDAVHSVLAMNRQQLQPSALVEEALVRLGVTAMQLQEDRVVAQETFEAWSHFASQLVFFHYLQLINITSLLNKLRAKVRGQK